MSFGRLFALFLVVPVLDLALLVTVGGRLGFWPTLGLVVATAAAGSWLARREGTAAWTRVQRDLAGGGIPGAALLDGLVILVAGVLLLTPGFLTDLAGLLGLIPATRRALAGVLTSKFEAAQREGRLRAGFGMPGGQPGAPPAGFGAPFGRSPFGGAPPVEDAEVLSDVTVERDADAPDDYSTTRTSP